MLDENPHAEGLAVVDQKSCDERHGAVDERHKSIGRQTNTLFGLIVLILGSTFTVGGWAVYAGNTASDAASEVKSSLKNHIDVQDVTDEHNTATLARIEKMVGDLHKQVNKEPE